MVCIEVEADGLGLVWRYTVADGGCVPAVGDEISLWHDVPGESDYSKADFVIAVVKRRRWGLDSNTGNPDEVEVILEVELDEPIPEGNVPDTRLEPASEWSEREEDARRMEGGMQDGREAD